MKDYKGYALFDEIEEQELRVRNNAVTMANIFEDNLLGKTISPKGGGLLLGYFDKVKDFDKALVVKAFRNSMKERGYAEVL